MISTAIRNLIFDLGGVIIDLDPGNLIRQMSLLVGNQSKEFQHEVMQKKEFQDYETGALSDTEFRDFIRSLSKNTLSDAEIDEAWNGILLDIPKVRLDLLTQLKENYKIFLLSNTNNIHLQKVITKLNMLGYPDFTPFFHKQYYSHVLKERKPGKTIYQIVLEDSSIMPEETLFLDDSLENLKGAEEVGIQTFHVKHPDLILELFDAK
ncbi:MAG: HAD family phosphatase [Bacteroidota bacterium]